MNFSKDSLIKEWALFGDLAACALLDDTYLPSIRQKQRYLKKYILYPYMRDLWPEKKLAFTNADYDAARAHYLAERGRVESII